MRSSRVLSKPAAMLASALSLGLALAGTVLSPGCEKDSSPGPLPDCSISVQSPNGGEAWTVGDSVTIAWDLEETCGDHVRISLLHAGQPCLVIADSAANSGVRAWRAIRCGADTADYAVRILDLLSQRYDDSDGTFTIDPAGEAPTVTVTAPNGGESFAAGEAVTITWECEIGCGATVTIELLRGGATCRTLAASAPNSGRYVWTAAQCDGHEEGYAILVRDNASAEEDASDAAFAVTSAPGGCSLVVTYPNGGESLVAGDPVTLTWLSSGDCGATVMIELLRDGAVCATLAASAANSGSHSWTAARCDDQGDGYGVRVTDLTSGTTDASDQSFAIAAPPPECALTVTAPEAGATFCAGDAVAITWAASGDCGNAVLVELLREDIVCLTIASTPNSGSYVWTAAQCAGAESGYSLRLTDTASGAAALSPGSFSIHSGCSIVAVSPQSGAVLCSGDEVTIAWTHGPCCGPTVAIELLHNGLLCATIASAAANSGSYAWTPAACAGAETGYALRIRDPLSGVTATTPGPFSIRDCECRLDVTHPSGGAVLSAGAAVTLLWDANPICGDQVRIELRQGGILCGTIAAVTDNDGSHVWTAAQCGDASSDYAIQVTDIVSSRYAISAPFFIVTTPPDCAIELLAPDGGEDYCAGETIAITWSAGDDCGGFARLDLYRDGALCLPISASTPNDGLFEWPAQQCDSTATAYTIRVRDLESGFFDGSDAAFAIRPPCGLDVLRPDGGETLCAGDSVTIGWTATSCCGANVRLELLRAGSVCLTIAVETPNDGSHTWLAARCPGYSEGYRVRVTDIDTGVAGESGGHFAIRESCVLDVLHPTAGANVCAGDEIDVAWVASDCCGASVTVELLRAGAVCATLAAETPNDGLLTWTAAQCDGQSDGYAIRVTDADGGADDESAPFTIQPPCALGVLSPNGGEILCRSGPTEVTWTAGGCCGGTVRLELLEGGAVCATLAAATPNDGSFPWTVQPCTAAGSDFTLRVTDIAGGFSDDSDAAFTIADPCAPECTSPAGGALFHAGETVAVTWTSAGCCDENVAVELLHGGTVCLTIANPTANDGGFNWTAAQCDDEVTGYVIRVRDLGSNNYDDTGEIWIAPANGLIVCGGATHDYATIQEALDAADDGDVILLCDGTHAGNGNRDLDFAAKAVTIRSLSGDPERCVIDCQGTPSDPHRAFVFDAGEEETSAVADLTIRHGFSTGSGGALHCSNGSSPLFSNCLFLENQASSGGAVYAQDTSVPSFEACAFRANGATGGGAVLIDDGAVRCTDCTFEANTSASWAGAIFLSDCAIAAEVNGCRFIGNAANYAGALYTENHVVPPVITHCTFSGNAGLLGYGALCWSGENGTLSDCVFSDNTGGQAGALLLFSYGTPVQVSDCEFRDNRALTPPPGPRGPHEADPLRFLGAGKFPELPALPGARNVATSSAGALEVWWCEATLSDCTFEGNSADYGGGAAACFGPYAATFEDCTFSGNTARQGGGLWAWEAPIDLATCDFTANEADSAGGAIHADSSTVASLEDCEFTANVADSAGGAIYLHQTVSAQISHCDFNGNQSDHVGGGLHCDNSDATLTGCTFATNAAHRGGGLSLSTGSRSLLSGCDFNQNDGAHGAGLYCYDAAMSLTGCTFTGNDADSSGAGIYCAHPASSPALSLCTLSGNTAGHYGGGIFLEVAGAPSIHDCDLLGNSAHQGGGLYSTTSSPILTYVAIDGNTATDNGGGLALWSGPTPSLSHCTITGNTAGSLGGGIFGSVGADASLDSCTVAGNEAGTGGGLHFAYSSDITMNHCGLYDNAAGDGGGLSLAITCTAALTHCTLCANSATANGGGLRLTSTSSATLDLSIISHGPDGIAAYCDGTSSVTADCCDVHGNPEGDWVGCLTGQLGGDNISADPQYCDLGGRDLRLQPGSPGDAGCGVMGAYEVGCIAK